MKTKLLNSGIYADYTLELLKARGAKNPMGILQASCGLQSPFDLSNMDAAIRLLYNTLEATNKAPSIGTIIDADADGFCSAAILYLYLKSIAPRADIKCYFHKGKGHGFGDLWSEIEENDKSAFDLFIVADAATNDQEYIKQMNCEVIVLDHHLLNEETEIAPNCTLVNNQTSPNYHNKELTGAGIALQFCRAYDEAYGFSFSETFYDIAALAVDADMGSGLEEENQWLWHYGFSHVANPFFKALLNKQVHSLKGEITPISVAFYIAPLINAMIRCGTEEEKERMFLAFIKGDELIESHKRGAKGTFDTRANESARECGNVKERQTRLIEQAEAEIETKIQKEGLLDNLILLIELDEDNTFPPELNGLLAMRCVSRHKRPTLVVRRCSDGYLKGSGRGMNASALTDLRKFLLDSGLFEYVSGHANAHGLSLPKSSVNELLSYANKELAKFDLNEAYYEVDFQRSADAADLSSLIEDIGGNAAIWATGNPEPLVHITNICLKTKEISVIGKNKDTVRFIKNGVTYVLFGAKERMKAFFENSDWISIDVVGKANVNVWNDRSTPQILISEFEVKPLSLEF